MSSEDKKQAYDLGWLLHVNVIAAFPKILIRNCELHFEQNFILQAETFQSICSLTKIGFPMAA